MKKETNFLSILLFANLLWFFSTTANSGSLLDFSKKSLVDNHGEIIYEGNIGLEIVSEEAHVYPGKELHLGVRIIHDPEWHTYWLNPGDTGLPTKIEWKFSQSNSFWGIENIQWPPPKRIFVGPLANFGYENEILLIQKLIAPANLKIDTNLKVIADVSWLVCKDVCIPGKKQLKLEIPIVKETVPRELTKDKSLFDKQRKNLPAKDFYSQPIQASFDFENESLFIFQDLNYQNKKKSDGFDVVPGFFFPLQEGLIQPAENQVFYKLIKNSDSLYSNEENSWILSIKLSKSSKELIEKGISDNKIEGVFVDNKGNGRIWSAELVERTKHPKKGTLIDFGEKNNIKKNVSSQTTQTVNAILFAFLGGLILNLMPCVFPVVGLKVLSITEGIKDQAILIKHGIGFVAGVILSVMFFATFFIIFRELGHSVGWGLQLQSAWVVLGLSILFATIAMNLAGAFEFGNSLSQLGKYDSGKGFMGAFFSGVLTVIVASPCTAPFMGGAIGFAATANLYVVFLIFLSLAIGISTPYFVLISQPWIIQKLPKPGDWMIKLRQFLAFPMLAASGWLLWVLVELEGSSVFFPSWLSILFVCLSLWVWGKFLQPAKIKIKARLFFLLIITVCLSISIFFFSISISSTNNLPVSSQFNNEKTVYSKKEGETVGVEWIPWEENLVEEYIEQGFVVFIDFTASWCVICQTNKIRVLETSPVVKELSQPGVIALRADWTNSDDKITQALFEYGRIGIPLNVVLGPNINEPILLSEWLTQDEVINAITKAKN